MLKLITLNFCKYFPFLLNTIPYEPASIAFSLTNRCNCRCIMCNYWKLPCQNELTTDEVKNILNQAREVGIKSCILYGGEPFLREDIFELVTYARKIGVETAIITNGTLIDRGKTKALAESGLNKIVVSLDLCSDELSRIRGIDGAYQRIIAALTELAKLRSSSNIEVIIASILMRPTLRENNLIKVIETAEGFNVPVIINLLNFSQFYFKDIEENIKRKLWITEENQKDVDHLVEKLKSIKKEKPWLIVNSIPAIEYFKQYFKDPKGKSIPCYAAFSGKLWVDPEGRLFLCQSLPSIGSLRKEPLKKILSSKKWREGIYGMFKKECPGCSCDINSNVNAHLPFAWKDILLRKLSIEQSRYLPA